MSPARLPFLLALALPGVACGDAVPVRPSLAVDPVCHYGFDHPVEGAPDREADLGRSGIAIHLVNGGAAMRVDDPAYPGAGHSLQTQQVNPALYGNDDWKAGIFDADGVAGLRAFNAVSGITLMGWVKPTGPNPGADTTTPAPDDRFGAVGLFGLLSGTSEGHLVRALIEVITVDGELRLVALGRREDNGESLLLMADDNWDDVLPANEWTHIAATFDFDEGTMTLYRNGEPLAAQYMSNDDRWRVIGDPEPDLASATDPTGIKIGGSYPQNNVERNPFDGRFDDLMFFDRKLNDGEIRTRFAAFRDIATTS